MALCSSELLLQRHVIIAVIALWLLQQVNGAYEEDEEHHEGFLPVFHEDIHEMCEEPPPPMNGEMTCGQHKKIKNRYVCQAICEAGFQFPNGRPKNRHACDMETGKWSPTYIFADCEPICNPPCENGGECSDANHCICTPQYRGDRCQYAIALCYPNEGLHASADWSCNHTLSETVCVFNCPQGTRYESQPADVYHCSLDGTWMPSFAPKCIPINVIEPPSSPGVYSSPTGQEINSKLPNNGVCVTWGASHYRTFDGGIYSFQGRCFYLFAKDCEQNTFAIHIQNGEVCESVSSCTTTVAIYIGAEQYLLTNGEEGPSVENAGQIHLVPTAVNGLLFEMISDYVTLISPLGFSLKWNRKNTVLLKATNQLRNRTCGLCGKFDGSTLNDFETSDGSITDSVEGFANSWIMEELGEKCEHKAVVKDSCSDTKDKVKEAEELCQVIFDKKFSICHNLVDPKAYYETCKMDHCSCQSSGMSCYCGSLAEYFRECIRLGGKIDGGWRSEDLCPLACPDEMIYKDCGTSCPRTCKGTVYHCEDDHCVDSCHCPEGTFLHNGRCLEKRNCPCLHSGKEYQPGERMLQECNACECNAGEWECTHEKCEARCSSTGDPHYTTFDGLSYEFLGTCPYYLVYHKDFTIVQESGPCPASFSSEPATELMFCTHAIKIFYLGDSLTLQPGIKMTFNDKNADLPFSAIGFSAAMVTNIFLKVNLENGVSVLWDGQNRIYIDAPPSLFGQTMGLCGTFNRNQNDDFQTPEKDLEADVATFAARWQASDACHKRTRRSRRSPCETQPQKLNDAEELCSAIIGEVFEACHGELEPEVYYKSCVSDLCLCGEKLQDCVCPILADYSLSCAKKGIILNWVDELTSCKPDCTGGQVYQECGNPCTSTCMAIASSEYCKEQCVQGCICPEGMTMSSEGFCIAIDQCPCIYEDKEYPPSSVTVQGSNVCTCQSAKWECRPGSLEELVSLNPNLMMQDQAIGANACLDENNEEFTQCMEMCPRTCQNAHLPPKCKTEECKPGCRCKEGFILDTDLNKCVKENQCGCLHSGRWYKEGETIKQHCNLCSCTEGSWKCSEKVCPGVCASWGESHFKTYDGKIFDFQGECEYILSKGRMKGASFTLSMQNVPCGSKGITCSKSFTLDLGPASLHKGEEIHSIGEHEKLTLTRDDPLPKVTYSSRFVVLESGLFVLVFTDIGISLQWDRGTRLYINADPKWRNRMKGLCGNFNDDQTDDFLTPSGGIPEARAALFADSWKIHEFCPLHEADEDTCSMHPQRHSWAQQKCGILKSDVFSPCHSQVALDPYYERCIFDSCACDMGGDCDCLCTAIAAYAHECSAEGVAIKWRSQELCPIQCEECATYESCIPSCPKETCENELIYSKIKEACTFDFCVEGCNPKPCPEGQIYNNGREYKCIPEVDCIVPCLELNGILYKEGDRITDPEMVDACQSCHCRRGSINCVGKPCTKIEPARACVQGGWTPWMNTPAFVGGDLEDLSNPLLKATYENYCGITNMTNIDCRVAQSKIPYKETGQNVECSLPTGLRCRDEQQNNQICEDYEIRVFCDCGAQLIIATLPPTTPPPPLPPMCETTGWTAWMNAHLPGQEGESETLERLRINHQFCADEEIENIECRTIAGWKHAPANDNAICNKKLGLVCNGPECNDYEVRVFCNCGKEIPTAPICVSGWTEYFNTDHPDVSDIGDDESIERIHERHTFCIGGTLEDIECKTQINGELVDYASLDTFGLKCSKNVGFVCNKYVRTDKCPDFIVRFYCACEPMEPTTPVPPTLPPTTLPPLQITPVPVECGWTPWLNIDTPDSGENDDGDIEDLSQLQMLYKTCGGKDLLDIECRMSRTLHSYSDSLQKNLVCDIHKGFRCYNEDQIGKCYDYEVRLLCMYDWCYPPTVLPEETTPFPTTTENPCPDGQVYDECAYPCDRLCSSFTQEVSEKCAEEACIASCRPIEGCEPPNLWRDYFTCVPKEECTCVFIEGDDATIIAPNEVIIKDCEKCQCVHNDLSCHKDAGCGITEETRPPFIYIPENITREDCWTEWINSDIPSTGGGDLETLTKIREKFSFCRDPVQIECRTADSKQKPFDVRQIAACDLKTGLICWNTDNKPEECYDYEIRFFCPCATTLPPTTTTTAPIPTYEPGPCVYGWTDWYNSHMPDDRGDYESVQSARVSSAQFCSNDMISAIECRPVSSSKGAANSYRLQHGVHCDLQTGLICSQENLGEFEACWDYEVRFFCDCPIMTTLTEAVTSLPTTTKLPILTSCGQWSEWINEHHPSGTNNGGVKGGGVKGGGSGNRGDSEKAMLLRLQREYKFCLEGYLSDIECREAETNLHYSQTEDKKLMCSLHGGFRCRARDQPNRLCKDYKIRYFCNCKEATAPPIITRPTTPPITVERCSDYYDIVDGPMPLPDSSLRASSSRSEDSEPQNARLSSSATRTSAGAWISGEINEFQFIEVDLGRIQPVYGVITKGRSGYQEWVKSYKVLYSRDGMAFAYISDANGEKIFPANYDNESPVEHVFERPFEARYVRIQPMTYHRELALRVGILGCAEGMTTVPTTTPYAPPCIDEMGMSNGRIADYQIKTSSNRNSNNDGRNVRLNTPQGENYSGGWVSKFLDQEQFVQIDFIQERTLTGVKLQGHDKIPQWVTAFTVSYSKDGTTWNYITDVTGTKVFPGNYDSNTVSTVYFPQPIKARFIRINPVEWENWISMRLEILGCYVPPEEVKDQLHTTQLPPVLEGKCIEPMGFESGELPNTLITVSSSAGPGSGVSRIRLNTHREGEATGGWVAATYDFKPVIIIDFYGERNLTGISTQGREDANMWVVSYTVQYSLNNITWIDAYDIETRHKVFSGNRDRNTAVVRWFSSMIQARFLKITIVDFHTSPALRMEVWGCFIPYGMETLPPEVLGTVTEPCVQYSQWLSLSDPASSSFGDEEPIDKIIAASGLCRNPYEIQCRNMLTHKDYSLTGQIVRCDLEHGLVCKNAEQTTQLCHNYEVRLKCWTCGIETTTTPIPLVLCPEVPDYLNNCPVSCPYNYACDGFTCVPHVDCPCFKDGKRFEPSNIAITKSCQRCECIIGGHSLCKPIECSGCLPGEVSQMDEHCNCECVGCSEGTVLCPGNGYCIMVDQWCDGVVDCTDDEINCPTTVLPTTTTAVPTTTALPLICSTDYPEDTDSCEMIANMFETFDGTTYEYEICDHVLMRDSASRFYSVTVHKTCSSVDANSCLRYLIIEEDGMSIKIGPTIEDITIQSTNVRISNLWLVAQRFQDFELMKKGNTLVFRSKKYHFDVIWDNLHDARITVSRCLVGQTVGLCGLYNKQTTDDKTTPDGRLVRETEEFGNSWSVGPLERCMPPTCAFDIKKKAVEVCEDLRAEPFRSTCSDYVKLESRIHSCISFMCECLQQTIDARSRPSKDVLYEFGFSSSCACLAYESFVEACESSIHRPVPEWRMLYDCTPDCPPGMEWQDCGPGCELTCDNYHERDSICSKSCIPGCYCPSGLIRHHNRCVKPKMCQDCVCRGHGDPNYITFDGRYYAFQGVCTYILAQHQASEDPKRDFQILATNVECPEEPHTSCTEGLKIYWNGHTIEKFKNKPVYLDDMPLSAEDSPFDRDGISITFIPGKSTLIHIKEINLAVRYFDQMYGFNIELPAFFYFNKTEGLCGVCNFIQSDDLYHRNGYVTEDIEDFAYSWLEDKTTRENCELERVIVPKPPPDICNFTISPCEMLLDPALYSKSCQNDITYSQKPEASMCRSKFQYAEQCCERGTSLVEWLKLSGCDSSCPEGMHFECTSACPKTCDNYKNYDADDCDLLPLYTCTCPEGQVMKLGRCIDSIRCETCDALGHIVGDVWNVGPCEQCECMEDLSTRCTITECPEPPICNENEKLEKLIKSANTCCDAYQCIEVIISCPEANLQECAKGEANVKFTKEDGCPAYKCECAPDLCPPLVEPPVDDGEVNTIETVGCCPEYTTVCYPEKCDLPPLCGPGFKIATFEGRCCTKYNCVPKKNVCVYQHKYDVLDGMQMDLLPENYYESEYDSGDSWWDGLCQNCSCVEIEGQYTSSCQFQICSDISNFPIVDKYVLEKIHVPGACCPKYRRISCIVDGIIFEIGEEWPSPEGDNCKTYRCVTDEDEEAIVLERSTICNITCPTNAVYRDPLPDSEECCGFCEAIACEENGVLYEDGATWVSTIDPCLTVECSVTKNGTRIVYHGESCPVMPDNCPMENVVTDPKGCCSYCKMPRESCSAVQVPLYETKGFFGYFDSEKGLCSNELSLPGLTKCSGTCTAESHYSNLFGDFQSVCNCCLPLKSENRTIVLICEDGSTVQKIYQQPQTCKCSTCSGKDFALEALNNIEPY